MGPCRSDKLFHIVKAPCGIGTSDHDGACPYVSFRHEYGRLAALAKLLLAKASAGSSTYLVRVWHGEEKDLCLGAVGAWLV
jgi:hypothetical protein